MAKAYVYRVKMRKGADEIIKVFTDPSHACRRLEEDVFDVTHRRVDMIDTNQPHTPYEVIGNGYLNRHYYVESKAYNAWWSIDVVEVERGERFFGADSGQDL